MQPADATSLITPPCASLKCCDRLRRILAKSFSQNIKKFEVYSEENIFLRANSGSAPAISSSTRDLLNQLRAEYAQELEAFESMSREKQQLAALLREMQASLFELRVSGQALDSLSLHPLDEAMARISQQVRQLSAMCINADGKFCSLFQPRACFIKAFDSNHSITARRGGGSHDRFFLRR